MSENWLKDKTRIIDVKEILENDRESIKFLDKVYQHQLFFFIAVSLELPICYRSLPPANFKHIKLVPNEELNNSEEIRLVGRELNLFLITYLNPEKVDYPRANDLEKSTEYFLKRIDNLHLKINILKGIINYIEYSNRDRKMKFNVNEKYNFKIKIEQYKQLIEVKEKHKLEENSKNNSERNLPYKIALLNEIGFFELDLIKNLTSKQKREIVQILIGGSDRQIKGNINVLNPGSKEDPLRYTSTSYKEEVKKYISRLFD
ncbi:hypothetical protein [Christiangramia sediminis]|uniref:Uncharacterized protein n=1 Tax=Christiangramia sediminis TaxID=2881336 RepID=A0A9X1LLA5_9FLAO|nr:hypothetical protein [Christiangramia sediminis]MCB7482468.1 hypothetical protein [Christiangramia sediminis]